ncbi:MAG: ATP-NAD kinase, partial [Thermoprotei archaeon]
MKLGFLVNPIAGMGGSVGLKGTDGELYFLALQRGATPVAPKRARRFLKKLSELGFNSTIVAANNVMGCNYLNSFKGSLRYYCVDIPLSNITSREDTIQVAKIFMREGVDIIAFVGGDGTARDIYDAVNSEVPLIGVPA